MGGESVQKQKVLTTEATREHHRDQRPDLSLSKPKYGTPYLLRVDGELTAIELLRFICALAILFWHYQHFFQHGIYNPTIGDELRTTQPLYWFFWPLYEYGTWAVPVFWLISGYIFYWHYAEAIHSRKISGFDFFIRRVSRLYPLHIVTMVLVAIGQFVYHRIHGITFIYGHNSVGDAAAQIFFASNWFARQPYSFNGPIWSVSAEILIYATFFLILRRIRPGIAIAATAALVAGLLSRHSGVFSSNVFNCGFFFFVGGIIAMVFPKLPSPAVLAVPARLGNATYSSYLIHFPLQLFLVCVLDASGYGRSVFLSPVALFAFVAVTVCLSLLTYSFFEVPAQNLIRRQFGRKYGPKA